MPNLDEFDIDHLKNAWQSQKVEDAYEQSEIEAMLNKKSKSYVKYIFWISLAEFLILAFLNIVNIFYKKTHSDFETILANLNLQNQQEVILSMDRYYLLMKIISVCMTGIFVILFYRGFKRIDVEANMKNFIQQIFNFKRTVNAFITCNIVLLIIFIIAFSIYLSKIVGSQNAHLDTPSIVGLLTAIVIALLVAVILILLYYRLVYGILLKRLSKTMSQLEQIEAEKVL